MPEINLFQKNSSRYKFRSGQEYDFFSSLSIKFKTFNKKQLNL